MCYGDLVLLPSILPVYGAPLPTWVWWGVSAEFGALVLVAFRSAYRRDGFGNRWGIAAVTSPGSAIIYAVGAALLLTRSFTIWEYLAFGAAGVVCLGILAWADRWSTRADTEEYRINAGRST